jgi:outer membrane protein assembly factor BamD (BamD/ComL family)
MRKLISILLIASTMLYASVRAENTETVRDATQAAQLWFASADAGLYDKTWEQAAVPFQQAVTKAEWEATLRAVRAPMGNLKNRSVVSATFVEELPGAPKGKYVVIQYASEYTKKAEAIETVIPMLGEDGTWRVSGYFVK